MASHVSEVGHLKYTEVGHLNKELIYDCEMNSRINNTQLQQTAEADDGAK